MSFIDSIIGEAPPIYDHRLDPRALPTPQERKHTHVHVDNCTVRWIELRVHLSMMARQQYYDRRLLIAIIVLLLLNKVIDLGQIGGLLGVG